jgi:acyl-CoA dehydrogenase
MYIAQAPDNPVAQVERALAATIAAEPIEAKLRAAVKDGRVDAKLPPGAGLDTLVERAAAAGALTAAEGAALIAARDATAVVIRVDDFAQDLGYAEMRVAAAQPAPARAVVHKAAA